MGYDKESKRRLRKSMNRINVADESANFGGFGRFPILLPVCREKVSE